MDQKKAEIAKGYYKTILTEKLAELSHLPLVSHDRFIAHVTHSDLQRLVQHKLISYDNLHGVWHTSTLPVDKK